MHLQSLPLQRQHDAQLPVQSLPVRPQLPVRAELSSHSRSDRKLAIMLETEGLVLRPGQPSDLESFARLWGLPEDDGVPRPPPLTTEEAWARLLRLLGHWASFGYGLFVVLERATGELIGEAGFADFCRGVGEGFDGAPEAAWRIERSRRGRGYTKEAMAAATRWLEEACGADRTVCMIHPNNAPSLAVAHRLGYSEFDRRPHPAYGTLVQLDRRRFQFSADS